jgi:hypothetical protein
MKKIKEKVSQCIFVFFSDDVEWCKGTFQSDANNYYFESGSDPVWEKLRLMYSCKHFIISNSTFAWWAQFLGSNPKKIVIAPCRWLRVRDFTSPLLEDHFIKLPVD